MKIETNTRTYFQCVRTHETGSTLRSLSKHDSAEDAESEAREYMKDAPFVVSVAVERITEARFTESTFSRS